MTEALLVTLRRRPIPNGGYHFMFVDHRDRAGFVPADQVPRIVGDTVVADVLRERDRNCGAADFWCCLEMQVKVRLGRAA